MARSTSLSRTIDYLGDLGAKLRDLQGYRTLAHELIQNADDAPASWMSFDIRQDALVLDNDGVFSSCEDIEGPQCPWRDVGHGSHRCDFHRFRLIGSGDKRLQEGTTGAFGIGFISVYQLTDQPELISAGRHWTLHEERSEAERIEVCLGCHECSRPDLPGTRFIFPFARDEHAPLRQALKAEPVPENVTERLLEELESSLPVAMLFLKNLSEIEVRQDGHSRRTFERVMDGDRLIIGRGDSVDDRVWHLLRGNFEDSAADLRRRHPGRIEDKRSSEVVIALPIQGELSTGMLCACLPTESCGLPFHVNADFFPSNDRKRVILGNDYQSQWNRAALLAAARTVAKTTPPLTKMLGAKRFWHLAYTLNTLALNATKDGRDGVWREFWSALEVALQREAVVLTSAHKWTTVNSGVAVLLQSEEALSIPVLEGLGINLVTEDLRPYQVILRSVGVPVLDIEILCSALTTNGLDRPVRLNDLLACLGSETGRAALWAETSILLERRASTPNAKRADEERLGVVSLAPTIDEALWPCQDAFRADAFTVELFASLGLGIPFIDQTVTSFEPLAVLCKEFKVEDAVQALEEVGPASIQQLWRERRFPLRKLIEWFENRRRQIVDDDDMCRRLAALPIYPSAGQLHPLISLILPGGFKDPFGLTNIVDVDALGGRREFLVALGVAELDFRTYVIEHLSRALHDDGLDPTVKQEALTLLADRSGELIDDDEAHGVLLSSPIVKCTTGEYHRPDDCYLPDNVDIVQNVLGNDANIAVLPKERKVAVRKLFDWLGIASGPRITDIVQTICRISDGPCSARAIDQVQEIVAYLGRRFEDIFSEDGFEELFDLESIEWLPARGDASKWHQPSSLYAPYRSYLFESQGRILDVPSPSRDFLEFLEVGIDPSPNLVVEHLLYCAERKAPVNTEVYRFLNDEVNDPAIERLRSTKCLWLGDAYQSPDHVFWGDHPFGQYRWRLADDLRGYGNLLEKIGVADTPDNKDALDVLLEISSEFGETNSPLDDETHAVLMNCWQMLESALNEGTVANDWLGRLGETKSIPNKDRVLHFPTRLFFENRAGLAAKFGFLENNIIPRYLGTGQAFLAAGVRLLGSAVGTKLLRTEDPDDDPDTMDRLRHRHEAIARVLSGQMASDEVRDALRRQDGLACKLATSLYLQYSLRVFDRDVESRPEAVLALYQPDQHSLWATHQNGQLPLAPLARELAIALCPEEDPGLFAAGLKEVLAAKTTAEAATVLDELGFSQLDTTVVEAPPSQEAAYHLGTEAPIDNDELPPQHVRDESQPDVTPRDGTETLAESESSVTGDAPPHRGREFVSYVAVSPDDEEGSEPDSLTHQERMSLEDKAIELIIKQEPELKRMPTNNPGFDLTESSLDGQPVKWVEVKAMRGTLHDRSVGLSRTQFECAQEHEGAYWLYIVESAGAPGQARVVRIQDPAGKAQTFTFDHGWVAVAEDIKAADPENHP